MKPSACLSRPASASWTAGAVVAVAAGLLLASPAGAASCGDSIDGRRVPCACGDIVSTDTVLRPTDPVVSERCTGNGLRVVAPKDSDGVTLNLGGQSIVGAGRGVGIRVVRGGRRGSVILGGDAEDGRAEIAGFDTGIRAHGRADLRVLRGVDVHHNDRYGVRIRTSGVEVEDVRSTANGKDGVDLSGHGNRVSGVAANGNGRDGIRVRGSSTLVRGSSGGNARHGAVVSGRGSRVESLDSNDNGGAGMVATGTGHDLSGVRARGNRGADVADPKGALR